MAENVTSRREFQGLLKAQGSVLSTMLKKSVMRKEAIIATLPLHAELSAEVVTIFNQKIGQDTFGVVSIGHIKTYDSFCAVKEGKYSRHFNAIFEARVLQRLAGCDYFPQFFSAFDGKLVMELIACKNNKVITVSSLQKENKLTSADWNVICFILASAVKYMHFKNLLHNHLKSNNVLLKLRNNVWKPKFDDMVKFSLKSNQETQKLSNQQKDRCNKINPHPAHELGNVFCSKTSFSSDIFLLGYIFKHLHPSSSILQLLTSKMLVHDPTKQVTGLYVFNTPQSCMEVVQEMFISFIKQYVFYN